MRKVDLRMNELNTYTVIKKYMDGNVSKQYCSMKLNVTRRTIDRYIIKYKAFGKAGFIHGNRDRKPSVFKSDGLKKDILLLYQNKYENANLDHFTELLASKEHVLVSKSYIRKLFHDHHILAPKAWKRTKKNEAKRLKQLLEHKTLSNQKHNEHIQSLLALEDAHPRRPRCANFGEVIQSDASIHLWYGDVKTSLHAAIDDATGIIVGLYMDRQETLKGYYNVLYQTLTDYGIPNCFFTDRRTVFEYKKRSSPTIEKDTFTQFSYACSILGIEIKTSSVPQAKGRVERLFQTLQSRLPIEFKLNAVSNLDEANEFLSHYKDVFNDKFALHIDDSKNVFTKQPDEENINTTLAVLSPRVVDCGHCIKFKNEYYIPTNQNSDKQYFLKGTKTMVIEAFNSEKYVTVGENIYALEKVENRLEQSPSNNMGKKQMVKKKYIPAMDHPWKRTSFEAYMAKMNRKAELAACA